MRLPSLTLLHFTQSRLHTNMMKAVLELQYNLNPLYYIMYNSQVQALKIKGGRRAMVTFTNIHGPQRMNPLAS